MKFISTVLFAFAVATANACEETMCAGATRLDVIECPECIPGPCHLWDCPDSIFSYICGDDKTKCERIS
ncbi:hypothetical protein CEP54_011939 [Fusarium duplospermum]|uniref:Uncharacterized protein n=1 Tax=Fusarium duplospermum TaxID=1325734 RepID=A0A428PBK0_9HYPO|nr:hypothetical protein CEP54_011939 [Fusarium duplospermum]